MGRQSTWTLTAIAQSEWGIKRILETVMGVKTSEQQQVANDLYAKYPDCHEVAIKKEARP